MNKIKVVNNEIIPFDDNNIVINGNKILFNSNGNYFIDYIDSSNINLFIELDDDVCINLFEYSNNKDIYISNNYELNRNSSLILNKFYYNDNTKEDININLNKEKANIKYNFSSISKNNDKYNINVFHKNKNTSSDVFNRVVALKDSSNFFDINSYVDNGVLGCYLNQSTKIVSLGESNNKINPNMFIGEESTTAIHSSTIGNINEDDLFYLMSRGISYKEAINLIIKGIILSNINPDMENRERILNILEDIGGE